MDWQQKMEDRHASDLERKLGSHDSQNIGRKPKKVVQKWVPSGSNVCHTRQPAHQLLLEAPTARWPSNTAWNREPLSLEALRRTRLIADCAEAEGVGRQCGSLRGVTLLVHPGALPLVVLAGDRLRCQTSSYVERRCLHCDHGSAPLNVLLLIGRTLNTALAEQQPFPDRESQR